MDAYVEVHFVVSVLSMEVNKSTACFEGEYGTDVLWEYREVLRDGANTAGEANNELRHQGIEKV